MSHSDELRENIHGIIYDKAIEYANGHVVNFYEVADDIMELVRQETIKAQLAEVNNARENWHDTDDKGFADLMNQRLAALESQLKEE